jgi:hypothetical protein
MNIIEVESAKNKKEFHRIPYLIYRNDRNWIPHLRQDVEKVFNPVKNKFFQYGGAVRWILKDDTGRLIGRVAAFIDHRRAKKEKQPTGGMGFFECIDDQASADLLFDTCREWLQTRGMAAMDGPINFGDRDRYWGLLIDGYDKPPVYLNGYNPPYYQDLFENYGFRTYFNQLVYVRSLREPAQKKFREHAEQISRDPDYCFRHLVKKHWLKFADDFCTIYNEAWASHSDYKKMSKEQARSAVKKLKPVMDEKLMWFGYYRDQPIAFLIMLPELNQIFRHLHGNLNWWGKLKFVYYKKKKICTNAFGIAFGIIPDHQGKGVEGSLIMQAEELFLHSGQRSKYENIILTWIGDFNPKMMRVVENLGTKTYQTLCTYRILFDENAPFERCPVVS